MATNGINGMTLETASLAGGDIEMMFLQQKAQDPFTATPERTAQVDEVAARRQQLVESASDVAVWAVIGLVGLAGVSVIALRKPRGESS